MKKFGIVLRYELKEYFNNKGFMTFTVLLSVVGAVLLCLPRFMNLSAFTGVGGKTDISAEETAGETLEDAETSEQMIYLDQAGVVDETVLAQLFPNTAWVRVQSAEEVVAAVEAQTAAAGYVITSPTEYEYYLYNKSIFDSEGRLFDEAMRLFYRMNYCAENGLDLGEITTMYNVPVTVHEQVLNKDGGMNYWYCYALVIIVFMMIMLYGQMIAVAVTGEKSNRAIEVLVTSTTPNSLLFGKVVAGAIGGLFQSGVILGTILLSYRLNRNVWGGMLDMVFNIPAEVLITFAMFGIGGYLFYGFLYGAMGALVSKTEDISKSAGGLQLVIMIVYFFSLVQLADVEGPVAKVLSFLPISSYSTMFARIAMGTVAPWEIVVSFLILVASIIGAGILGAKIYRMGTLRYGNPIKISTALKDIRRAES